jgi:hypothetical protein
MWFQNDPSRIDLSQEIRTLSFENPDGGAGTAGSMHGGRKGAPMKLVEPGERVLLGDVEGPGTIRHLWMTFPPMTPEVMRALRLEISWDDASEPSVRVPVMDFLRCPTDAQRRSPPH